VLAVPSGSECVNQSRHGAVGVAFDLLGTGRGDSADQGAHKQFALQQPDEAVPILFRVVDLDQPLFD